MSHYTTRSSFPAVFPHKKAQLCIVCREESVCKVMDEGHAYFVCDACGAKSERYLAWDPHMVQYFNEHEELVHESVGIVVQNTRGEVLLFKRVKYPFLWTIPAGHLEVGEDPYVATLRELAEETGVVAQTVGLLYEGEVRGDACVGGADVHMWHLYHAVVQDVVPTIEVEEGAEWKWYTLDDLPENMTYPVAQFMTNECVCRVLRNPVLRAKS
ncbi:MAG: NUDIX hydrolase [Candidatus Pacebacteria bacterium]|nr:NUDIX hydrolase [Candidatus Paceibacterota bacterium]